MRTFRGFLVVLLVLGSAATVWADEIRGRVTTRGGKPVPGAAVTLTVAGRTYSVTAGADGAFTADVPGPLPRVAVVIASAAGMKSSTLTVTRLREPIRVVLEPAQVFSEAIEVTANRATSGRTPVTFSNVTRDEIERSYWGQDVPIFLSQIPGFYAYNDNGNGIGYSYFTLRGFDMRRTAVSLNGVPLNDAEGHGVFFIDLADFLSTTGDIQVQRGVGTTLYGGSAIGGSVDLRTRHPLLERRLRVSAMRGSWDTTRWNVEYDTGLSKDGWAAAFRWSRIDTDGYRDQSWVSMWNYFGTVEHYGNKSTLRLVLFGGPEETHLAYLGVPKAYLDGAITGDRRRDRRFNPLTYPGEIDHFFQPQEQLIHTLQVTKNLTLQNTLYYFQGNGYFKQFKTNRWLPEYGLPSFQGPGGGIIDHSDLIRKRTVDEWDAGWIGQVDWRHGNGRGRFQGGVAVRIHRGHHYGEVLWAQFYPPGTPPDHRYYDYEVGKHTYQPFVQETWELGRDWTLLGGATWTSHRYKLEKDRRKGVHFTQDYSFFLPRVGLGWHPGGHWNLFANVSRGGREPAFRDIYDPQDYYSERTNLEEEKLTDYELGGEYRWKQGFAKLNLYWLHFDNEIVWAGALDDSGVPINANGAVANHRGVELETAWNPSPRWGARLALSYSLNTFSHFTEFDWDGNPLDHSGNRIAGVPDWLGTLQLSGGIGPVDALLTLRYVGRFYLDNTQDERKRPQVRSAPGYIHRVNDDSLVTDLSLRWDLGGTAADWLGARRVGLDLRVNNLTDELYTTFGYMDGAEPVWTPAATRSVYAGLTVDW